MFVRYAGTIRQRRSLVQSQSPNPNRVRVAQQLDRSRAAPSLDARQSVIGVVWAFITKNKSKVLVEDIIVTLVVAAQRLRWTGTVSATARSIAINLSLADGDYPVTAHGTQNADNVSVILEQATKEKEPN